MAQVIEGDIWEEWASRRQPWVIVSTNLQGRHGRGLARQALDKGLLRYGANAQWMQSPFDKRVIVIAVKHKPWERLDVQLMKAELRGFSAWWRGRGETIPPLAVPMIGAGFAEGDPRIVRRILEEFVDQIPGAYLVTKSAGVRDRYRESFRPGWRQDRS